ncbi:MAG: hypothetical protein QOK02_6617 [Mycobacterium sp.]|jgi:hypothetical protein|nr:hypothetical protein [Mycobacterium sp.]
MNTALNLLQTSIRRVRQYLDEARFNTPMVAQFLEDADYRRTDHDLDAIRTRFERSPMWPVSGALGERR